jgi:hypothetical protein
MHSSRTGGPKHCSLQAFTVEMNPSGRQLDAGTLHLSSSSASAIDMTTLSSETIDVDIFSYQLYSIFIKSDVNRVTQHCINVNDTLLAEAQWST